MIQAFQFQTHSSRHNISLMFFRTKTTTMIQTVDSDFDFYSDSSQRSEPTQENSKAKHASNFDKKLPKFKSKTPMQRSSLSLTSTSLPQKRFSNIASPSSYSFTRSLKRAQRFTFRLMIRLNTIHGNKLNFILVISQIKPNDNFLISDKANIE